MARIFQHMALLIFVSLGETVAGSVISWHRSPGKLTDLLQIWLCSWSERKSLPDKPFSLCLRVYFDSDRVISSIYRLCYYPVNYVEISSITRLYIIQIGNFAFYHWRSETFCMRRYRFVVVCHPWSETEIQLSVQSPQRRMLQLVFIRIYLIRLSRLQNNQNWNIMKISGKSKPEAETLKRIY